MLNAAKKEVNSIVGTWYNQNGSIAKLQVDDLGRINGTFLPAPCCGQHDGHEYPLTGYAQLGAFAFCVAFTDHGSVTSWTGHVTDDGLETIWQMAISTNEQNMKLWQGTWTGVDTFGSQNRSTIGSSGSATSYPRYCSLI